MSLMTFRISVVVLRLVELSKLVDSFHMFDFNWKSKQKPCILVRMISKTIYSNISDIILRRRYVHCQHWTSEICLAHFRIHICRYQPLCRILPTVRYSTNDVKNENKTNSNGPQTISKVRGFFRTYSWQQECNRSLKLFSASQFRFEKKELVTVSTHWCHRQVELEQFPAIQFQNSKTWWLRIHWMLGRICTHLCYRLPVQTWSQSIGRLFSLLWIKSSTVGTNIWKTPKASIVE